MPLMDTAVTNLPHGSPILAYGHASRFPSGRFVACLIGLLAAASIVAIMSYLFLFARIHLPENTIVLAYLSGSRQLPKEMPRLWREAVANTGTPIILGLAKTASSTEPFVLSLRSASVIGIFSRKESAYLMQSDAELPAATTSTRVSEFALNMLRSLGATSYIDATIDDDIGPIRGRLVHHVMRFPPSGLENRDLPPGDVSLAVDSSNNGTIRRVIESLAPGISLSTSPESLSWSFVSGTETLILQYPEGVPEDLRHLVLQYAGMTSSTSFQLPDRTLAEELTTPTSTLFSTENAALTENSIRLGPVPPSNSNVRGIFFMDSVGIRRILDYFGFPDMGIQEIRMSATNNSTEVTFK